MTTISADDEFFMAQALTLAAIGRYTTRPNPCVGCVLVKDGVVIGTGFHQKAGEAHAEVLALRQSGDRAFGATAYVNLEPCSHTGRTPPCCDALIKAGIARVVVAGLDPNPKVAGSGADRLRAAGIDVTVGVLQGQAQALNAGFLKAMAKGMPYVRLKLAVSLDGKIAMKNGQSQWITGKPARIDVQKLRALSGAIITGSGTVLADNPALTVRTTIDDTPAEQIPPPKIVVVDRRRRLQYNDSYQVFTQDSALLWHDDLLALLQTLVAKYQCYDVLVESGAKLASAFLGQGLVDELIIYQAPCLLGVTARPMFELAFEQLDQQLRFRRVLATSVGNDLKIVFVKDI